MANTIALVGVGLFLAPMGMDHNSGTRWAKDNPPMTSRRWWENFSLFLYDVNPLRLFASAFMGERLSEVIFGFIGLAMLTFVVICISVGVLVW